MAFINIHTNNLSRELSNSVTYVDNWAYVPGTAITGDYRKPYAFQSLEEFKSACGTHGPEGSITFQYVSGLLNAGIPVLFRRIACKNQDTASEELGVTKAKLALTHHDSNTDSDITDATVYEKYGGTYGNDINISIKNTGTAYWLEVYLKYTLLERARLITIDSSKSQLETNADLIKALQTTEFDRIEIDVNEEVVEDPSKFDLQTISGSYLSGGTDFDENAVAAEIPKSYEFIEDKILYQPKFITSGGYTDIDVSSSSPIASAMKNLTLARQDCRALIDLPIGTKKEDYASNAAQLGYQQLSDSQAIPSASMYGPWQYMQVGNEQLWMPPSYVFLTVVGSDLSKGGKVYTPKAGVTTGQVSNILKSEFEIGSALSQEWQSDSSVNINPIMRLQGGQYVIAGNSTLLTPEVNGRENNAFSESSADLTIIEIKRFVYNLATELQYQYNSTTAFETFALRTSKFLQTMQSEGSVTDFDISNVSTDSEPRKLKVKLDVYLSPTIKSIELFLNVAYGSIEVSTGGVE